VPVSAGGSRGWELRQRFEREARVVAALQHPRICTLMDIGTDQGTEYLVMEYLEGGTLTCPQPLEKVIEYGIQPLMVITDWVAETST
jgi:eukaryotic-like serine/threonine-protein kinase